MEFEKFPKIYRSNGDVIITEKLDGTNAQIGIKEIETALEYEQAMRDPHCLHVFGGIDSEVGDNPLALYAGSRNRWLTVHEDNFGFANWVVENLDELQKLGPGRHYGEWYGLGIQRGYAQAEKHLALFNVQRWGAHNLNTPACVEVVTTLNSAEGFGRGTTVEQCMYQLYAHGSAHVPGFLKPEGIIVYHCPSRTLSKTTFENSKGKWTSAA